MIILFCVYLVVFYFCFGQFSVARVYLAATNTSVTVYSKNASLLANLQLAALSGDISWHSRLFHKNSKRLQNVKQSLDWLYFLTKQPSFKLVYGIANNLFCRFSLRNSFFLKKELRKEKLKPYASPEKGGPNPESFGIIQLWLENCIKLFCKNNFSLLEKQFDMFLQRVKTNTTVFALGFDSLEDLNLTYFFEILIFMGSTYEGSKQKSVNISDFDLLFQLFLKQISANWHAINQPNNIYKNRLIYCLISLLLNKQLNKLPKTKKAARFLLARVLESNLLQVVSTLERLAMLLGAQQPLNGNKVQQLIWVSIEAFQPSVKWFLLEQLIFWVSKNLFFLLLKSVSATAQYEACVLLIKHKGAFSKVFSFLLKELGTNIIRNKKFWALLVMLLLTSEAAVASELNVATNWASNFAFLKMFPLCSLTFQKASNRWPLNATKTGTNNTPKRRLAQEAKLELILNWLEYNKVDHVDRPEIKANPTLGQSTPFIENKKRRLKVEIGLRNKEITLYRTAYANREAFLAAILAPESNNSFWQDLWEDLRKRENVLPVFGFTNKPYEKESQAAFQEIVCLFFSTLLPNSEGSFSLCGSVYPYSLAPAVRSLFASCYELLKQEKYCSYNGLLASIKSSNTDNEETAETGSSEPENVELKQAIEPECVATATESSVIEACHVYPLRVTAALCYDHPHFLAIFLPKTLNKSVEELIFGQGLWYADNYGKGSHSLNSVDESENSREINRFKLKPSIDLTSEQGFSFMIDRSFELGWETKLKERTRCGNVQALKTLGISPFAAAQQAFITQSYKAALLLFCNKADQEVPLYNSRDTYIPFMELLAKRSNLPFSPKPIISVQERLLHLNTLVTLENYLKPSLVKLVEKQLNILLFSNIEDILENFSAIQNTPRYQAAFFETVPAAQQIKNNVVLKAQETINYMVFAFTAAISSYWLVLLKTEDRKRISKAATFVNLNDNGDLFKSEIASLIQTNGNFPSLKKSSVVSSLENLEVYTCALYDRFLMSLQQPLVNLADIREEIIITLPDAERWCPGFEQRSELELIDNFQRALVNYLLGEIKAVILVELTSAFLENQLLGCLKVISLCDSAKYTKPVPFSELNQLLDKAGVSFRFDSQTLQTRDYIMPLENITVSLLKQGSTAIINLHVFLFSFPQFRELFSQREGGLLFSQIEVSLDKTAYNAGLSNDVSQEGPTIKGVEASRDIFEPRSAGIQPQRLTAAVTNLNDDVLLIKPDGLL